MVPSKATLRQLNNTFDLNVLILESSSSVLLFAQLLLQIKNTCLPSHWTERKGNQKATQLIAKLVGVDLTIKLFWIKESHQTKNMIQNMTIIVCQAYSHWETQKIKVIFCLQITLRITIYQKLCIM